MLMPGRKRHRPPTRRQEPPGTTYTTPAPLPVTVQSVLGDTRDAMEENGDDRPCFLGRVQVGPVLITAYESLSDPGRVVVDIDTAFGEDDNPDHVPSRSQLAVTINDGYLDVLTGRTADDDYDDVPPDARRALTALDEAIGHVGHGDVLTGALFELDAYRRALAEVIDLAPAGVRAHVATLDNVTT